MNHARILLVLASSRLIRPPSPSMIFTLPFQLVCYVRDVFASPRQPEGLFIILSPLVGLLVGIFGCMGAAAS